MIETTLPSKAYQHSKPTTNSMHTANYQVYSLCLPTQVSSSVNTVSSRKCPEMLEEAHGIRLPNMKLTSSKA